MFEMRPFLIKILVIALAVLLLGAGAAYAAYEEAPSKIDALPGLEISPTSLDFGEIEPYYGPDANHMSNKIALTVKNVGQTKVSLVLTFDNLPQGLSVQEDTANSSGSEPGTLPGTTKIRFGDFDCEIAPGGNCVLHPYVLADSDIAPGTYQFKVIVKGF